MNRATFLLFLFLNIRLFSQNVTAVPQYPTTEDSVTIYFNAENTPLSGYTGDVYVHTGVNLNTGQKWQYVIGTWGNNNTQPKLTKIAYNRYMLKIKPSIRAFYGIPSDKYSTALCFVFRSADATKQTADIFYPVYTIGTTFISPDSNAIVKINDSLSVTIVALGADSIKLFVADTLFFKTNSNVLTTKIAAKNPGRNSFFVKSFFQNDSATTYSSFFVTKPTVYQNLPESIQPGINYLDSSSVILALFAPFKEFIYVLGDFNNWQLNLDYQMNLDPDTPIYWLKISNLQPGQEYAYQYYIDGKIKIADPYTPKVLDPYNDSYILPSCYPNLKPYPSKATGIVSILQPAAPAYNWKVTNFQRPSKSELIIYELLVRDFVQTHCYSTLVDTISYLKRLGINAVELMPINEFEGNISWGYNPSFYFAVDKYYGPQNELKRFIDSCHANGIAVILDVVFNHSFSQSPLVQMYFDEQTKLVTPQNPWYNVYCPNTVYCWGYDFNHQSPHTRYFIKRVLKYWLEEFKVDGFRLDFTKGFTNTPGDGSAYDASRIDILTDYYNFCQTVKPGTYFICEHFTDNSEENTLANRGILLWGNLNYAYTQASMGYLQGSNFSGISYRQRGWTYPHLVGYMESHDEERLMYKNKTYGASSGSYNVKDLYTALQRIKLVSTFFLTVPGPKMIWQFGELGYDYSIDYNGRTSPKPIRWDYYTDTARLSLFNHFSELISLRKKYKIFHTNIFTIDAANITKTITLKSDTATIFIVGNFGVNEQNVTLNFPQKGLWYEHFSKTKIYLDTTKLNVTLQPGQYFIYSTFKTFDQEPYLKLDSLIIYPNPTTDFINISKIEKYNKLEIFSLSGQKVFSLELKNQPHVSVNCQSFSRGLYIVRLTGKDEFKSLKFIKF